MIMKLSKNESSPALIERRSFLSTIWIALGLVALAEFITGGVSFFVSGRKNKTKNAQAMIIEAGTITDFPPGTVTLILAGNCYLSRLDNGGFLAISRKCTHLGCAVPWVSERNQFECPCHASVFDNTGNVVKSPAPRALELYPIHFENDRIKIDIGQSIKRANFSDEQLTYFQETA